MSTKQKKLPLEEEVLPDLNTRYAYVLAEKNETGARPRVFDANTNMVIPDRQYRSKHNLLLKSAIVWDGSDYKEDDKGNRISGQKAGKRMIRYYDGCTTLFVDEQPKDKETIEQLMTNTRELLFVDGFLFCYGYDTMLKKYLDICSWNGESPYKIKNVNAVFVPVDIEREADRDGENLDLMEEAMEYAKTASTKKMMVHAHFLGIADVDLQTGNPLSEKAIRTAYRKAASSDPKRFVQTFNDSSIQTKAWIEKALESGVISTTLIPNKAVLKDSGVVVCDISGLQSHEGILNRLIEMAQSKEGAEFKEHLSALYN